MDPQPVPPQPFAKGDKITFTNRFRRGSTLHIQTAHGTFGEILPDGRVAIRCGRSGRGKRIIISPESVRSADAPSAVGEQLERLTRALFSSH
ncbi:MAG: hypothetical protein V4726_01035 [Verrucomicrobiota bacterium]